jgi:ectoine hydroxylase-related dioxygenase (phytanoyl-CoA dioxygenase family)
VTEQVATAAGLRLPSNLWLDQDDYEAGIDERLGRGAISPAQADGLLRFARDGYVVLDLEVEEALLDRVVAEAAALWRSRPADVAYAYDGPARRMSLAEEARDRKPRHRIHDLHSHSASARALYLNPWIHATMRLILGADAVAIQSLFFEYGSQQILHRDPVVVPTGAPGHLVAAWIALEDITPESGALVYVPGSHRLPYYEFAPGCYMFDGTRMGAAEIAAATAFDDEQAARHGLVPQLFTARKGQALLWHGSLRHGGGPVVGDPPPTRKSLVVHFSNLGDYAERAITVVEPDGAGGERRVVMATSELLREGAAAGFQSPMLGRARA